ncbi:MAG: polyprenyl synthetase family protein [Candidatus Bathyarchaeales archaeon]
MTKKSLTFGEYWLESKRMIDGRLESFLNGIKGKQVAEIAREIIAGGKRFRGCLCLLICEALGGNKEMALDAAVALELLQAASLTHDDILDLDITRRGKPSAYIMHGLIKAILVPYIIVSYAREILIKYGSEAVLTVERGIRKVATGEVMDLLKTAPYKVIIKAKTAEPFALSTVLGAIIADAEKEMVQLAYAYGINTGLAYQVMDDLCDLAKGTPVAGLTSLERGEKMMENYVKQAKKCASKFPETEFKQLLHEAPRFMVNKMAEEAGYKLKLGKRR